MSSEIVATTLDTQADTTLAATTPSVDAQETKVDTQVDVQETKADAQVDAKAKYIEEKVLVTVEEITDMVKHPNADALWLAASSAMT
jgi:predicted RNA-binding protein with EMAP domain